MRLPRPVCFLALSATALCFAGGCDSLPDIVGSISLGDADLGSGGAVGAGGAAGAVGGGGLSSEPPPPPRGQLVLSGDLLVHDPSVIEASETFYLFQLGEGVPFKTSTDLLEWNPAGRVFDGMPASITAVLPGTGDLWAPDVSFDGENYHLYYARSTFGTGKSCIGHATTSRLGSTASWTDEPLILCSNIDSVDDFDAIDPSAFSDQFQRKWLVFGSYHSGIKLVALDSAGRSDGSTPIAVAARPTEISIQAAHLLFRAPYYYLVASFGQCCSGVNSTSDIRVGRATNVEGPYVDRDGLPMLEGGGTVLVTGDERYRAVGGSTILQSRGVDYLIYHAYDADSVGQAVLRITEFSIDAQGWMSMEK